MKNSQFVFKQFSVRQDKCSMKVGTDGVLLGAMISSEKSPKKILDIGTGTGLLALMMAQKFSSAKITAIDVDAKACLQAKENSMNSPWADRIEVFHTALQNYSSTQQFDCILSNPPFYQNAKKSSDEIRAQSRNEEFLPAKSIFEFAQKSLSFDGDLWLIYPIESLQKLNQYAKDSGLSLKAIHYVRPNILKACHRVIVCYGKSPVSAIETDITCIEILQRHDYSAEYKQLCKVFYLHF
ncbi:MAG: methyltransferase [Bacteroidales bacterium]|jgi:tRNA1Val (adenine37-N6)-methyltransferase|nr:methyltransferase [Bacteroidales bacterium]